MDGYISVTGLRLNQIMMVLTVVTVVFLPLLVGIYGTNLEYMPELKFTNAYFVLLGVIGLIVAVLLLFFWKMRWIRIAFWPQAMTPLAWSPSCGRPRPSKSGKAWRRVRHVLGE